MNNNEDNATADLTYDDIKHNKDYFYDHVMLAMRGQAYSQYELAFLYHKGYCVERNDRLMVFWMKKAACLGHAGAQYGLAVCYANGVGVLESYSQELVWLARAADKNHARARDRLNQLRATVPRVLPEAHPLSVSPTLRMAATLETPQQSSITDMASSSTASMLPLRFRKRPKPLPLVPLFSQEPPQKKTRLAPES